MAVVSFLPLSTGVKPGPRACERRVPRCPRSSMATCEAAANWSAGSGFDEAVGLVWLEGEGEARIVGQPVELEPLVRPALAGRGDLLVGARADLLPDGPALRSLEQ